MSERRVVLERGMTYAQWAMRESPVSWSQVVDAIHVLRLAGLLRYDDDLPQSCMVEVSDRGILLRDEV